MYITVSSRVMARSTSKPADTTAEIIASFPLFPM
ncbi:hypothetical protein AHiyo1_24190 [Arthrobacter sp. Hiyo1]|nr:hypothetical protein AHiyo1_24190 [Arthrobacter sp. Hiyo1]